MTHLTLSHWTIFHSWNYIIYCMMSHFILYHIYYFIISDIIQLITYTSPSILVITYSSSDRIVQRVMEVYY